MKIYLNIIKGSIYEQTWRYSFCKFPVIKICDSLCIYFSLWLSKFVTLLNTVSTISGKRAAIKILYVIKYDKNVFGETPEHRRSNRPFNQNTSSLKASSSPTNIFPLCSSQLEKHYITGTKVQPTGYINMVSKNIIPKQAPLAELKLLRSPVSQSAPVKVAGQRQVKFATWLMHSPPFRQGCDSHSFMSGEHKSHLVRERRHLSAAGSVSH